MTGAAAAALWFYYSRNEILLSGDAVAHINIARHVFDSRTPGLLQLGSVWLPLPHLLTIPFVINARMWQSGIGGSIVSFASYILAGLGLFHLLALWSRVAAWTGTIFFALNPNLLYVQTTALNEPLYLACFVWAALLFVRASRALSRDDQGAADWIEKGSMVIAAGVLTRYDGWFLACLCWAVILPGCIRAMRKNWNSVLRKRIAEGLLLTILAPGFWLAYNLGVYGNALEFANGPYSAKAIAKRTTQAGAPPYPGEDHALTAGIYFVKSGQLIIGGVLAAKLLVVLAAVTCLALSVRCEWLPVALLWSPVVFYALSIAYGSVPIFIPAWWPFSYYNVRYGLELLPAIAMGIGLGCYCIERLVTNRNAKTAAAVLIGVLAIASYASEWRDAPICLRETRTNGRARMELDRKLAVVLRSLPEGSIALAYTGAHSGAFELADFPLRRTINEGNFFIWDASLVHPASAADYVIAADDDPVALAVAAHPAYLREIAKIKVDGQARTVVFQSMLKRSK